MESLKQRARAVSSEDTLAHLFGDVQRMACLGTDEEPVFRFCDLAGDGEPEAAGARQVRGWMEDPIGAEMASGATYRP